MPDIAGDVIQRAGRRVSPNGDVSKLNPELNESMQLFDSFALSRYKNLFLVAAFADQHSINLKLVDLYTGEGQICLCCSSIKAELAYGRLLIASMEKPIAESAAPRLAGEQRFDDRQGHKTLPVHDLSIYFNKFWMTRFRIQTRLLASVVFLPVAKITNNTTRQKPLEVSP